MNMREYIEQRVERIPFFGCWVWTNAVDSLGYGSFRRKWKGITQRAHRAAYEAFIGNIPADLWVCHTCDIRSCCNPAHLFLGTRQDNINDAMVKGRLKGLNRVRPRGLIYKPMSEQGRFNHTKEGRQLLRLNHG